MSSPILKNIKLRSWVSFTQHVKRLRSKINTLNFWIMLFCDASCILLAYLLAHYLRCGAFLLHERQLYYAGTLPLILRDQTAGILPDGPV